MKKFFFILIFLFFNSFTNSNALDVKEVNYYKDKNAWLVNDENLPIVALKFAAVYFHIPHTHSSNL